MAAGKKAKGAPGEEPLSREEALRILEQRTTQAQHELASRTDADADVLAYLASNGAPATRRAVAANLAAPPEANRTLASDDDEDVRTELARKIARLMPDLPKGEQNHLRKITLETLERLARDQIARVRAILAQEIKTLDCVPKDVVRRLAQDVEIIVAGPILQYSPLLSDADLIEIIAAAKAGETLAAIAARKPLSAKISDAIACSLDIPAVASLLTNADATIRTKTLDDIIVHAEGIASWHLPLVLRADLSPRAIRRIASFVGSDLIEKLVGRRGLDEKTRVLLNKRLRAKLEDTSKAPQPSFNAAAMIAEAKRSGALDNAFVESAADAGQREVVILALGELTKIPVETVRRILATPTAKPVTALVWRAGLGMRAAFKIQTSVMRLPARELLAAREGVHFPLGEDEMRWHLAYFGVSP
jgi:uncharacterized protein (DUF2336 family)